MKRVHHLKERYTFNSDRFSEMQFVLTFLTTFTSLPFCIGQIREKR
jgi:hypothetical protein